MSTLKSYFNFLWESFKKAFGPSWSSANNIVGVIIPAVLSHFIHIFTIQGTTNLINCANENIIPFIVAYAGLTLFQMIFISPFRLWKEVNEIAIFLGCFCGPRRRGAGFSTPATL